MAGGFARTRDEVQRAHDVLVAIVLREIDLEFDEAETKAALANLDVLCWLLGHDHNQTFAGNLANVFAELEARGIVATKAPRPMTRDEWDNARPEG